MRLRGVRAQLFWHEDIRNVLNAVQQTNAAVLKHMDSAEAELYEAGFRAALEAVATGLGVDLEPGRFNADANVLTFPTQGLT